MLALMTPSRKGAIVPLLGTVFLLMASAPGAPASGVGGVAAEPGASAPASPGGTGFGDPSVFPGTPRITSVRAVKPRVTAGQALRIALRVDRPRAKSVHVRAVVAGSGVRRLSIDLGHLPTGREVAVSVSAQLSPGRYRVRLLALGRRGEHAVQGGSVARVIVVAPRRVRQPPKLTPAPAPAPVLLPPTGTVATPLPITPTWMMRPLTARHSTFRAT